MAGAPYRGAMTSFVLRRARLVDVDGAGVPDEPVDVRVTAGVVTAVGEDVSDPGLPEIDAGGRWLLPGLWDQHVHLGQWNLASARLDLGAATSAAEAVALVRARLAEWPDRPVIGWGHRPTGWPEDPVVSMLDAIDTDQPVILIAGDGHHAWLNSTALMVLAMPMGGGWSPACGTTTSTSGSGTSRAPGSTCPARRPPTTPWRWCASGSRSGRTCR